MTISVEQAGRLKTEHTILATTSQTTVYTARDRARPVVTNILVANTSGGAVTVIVVRNTSSTDYQLTGTASIAANDTLEITTPIAMLDDDTIKATAGTGSSSLHVTVTALEGADR